MHFLYRHFDVDGNLLYVGISLSAIHRLSQHKEHAHWFAQIQRVEIEQFQTREDALMAEREAIARENPAHNLMRPSVEEVKKSKKEISAEELTGRIVQFNPTYTIEAVATALNVGPIEVRRWIDDGKLGFIEVPRKGTWNNGRGNGERKSKPLVTGWQLIEFIEAMEHRLLNG